MELLDGDTLCRYAVERSYFKRSKSLVLPKAFLPNREGKTSVFVVTDRTVSERWDIGEVFVARPLQRSLKALIEFAVKDVLDAELSVVVDDRPPGHANIVGWPNEPQEIRAMANKIARKAKLILPISP